MRGCPRSTEHGARRRSSSCTTDRSWAIPTPLPHVLDNLIAQKRVPAMIAIMIQNGGGDAQGSERGLEYDTLSGKFAEFIETEVLPQVEKNYGVKLTQDPEGRAAMGCSSGGGGRVLMAWYHPEWYHRVSATPAPT